MSSCFADMLFLPLFFPFNLVVCLVNVQRNYTLLILSMDHTTIEASTLEITSMNMQAMTVTTTCMFLFSSASLIYYYDGLMRILFLKCWSGFICRYPHKDEQYHFFRHYLQPEKPHEVCKDCVFAYVWVCFLVYRMVYSSRIKPYKEVANLYEMFH